MFASYFTILLATKPLLHKKDLASQSVKPLSRTEILKLPKISTACLSERKSKTERMAQDAPD